MPPPAESLRETWALIESGKLDEAERLCAELRWKAPQLHETRFAQGVIRFRRGDKSGALTLLQEFLDLQPGHLAALGLAAQLYLESGVPEKAIELGQRAYDLRPDEGPLLLLHLTGRARLAMGQPLSALKAFQELANLVPDQPSGYLGAADAYTSLGSSFDAVGCLERAAEIAPAKATLLRLAILDLKLGRPGSARAFAERVLAKEPADSFANILAGQSLIEEDRDEESRAFWERADAATPDSFSVALKHGASLTMMGKFEEGEEFLRRSIELEPRQGSAYHLIFANRKAREDDRPMLTRMEGHLRDEAIAPTERAALAFAIGKASDDLNDPEKAFRLYDEAHEIQRGLLPVPFDPGRLEEQFAAQKALFSGEPAESHDDEPRQPIFVVGMLRSGTTLTEQILAAHSEVVGAGEVDFWTASEPLMVDRATPAFLSEVGDERRRFYRKVLDSFGDGRLRVVDKYPGNLNVIGMIHHLYPKAPIIHLRRNPIDIAVSLWATHSNPFSPFTVQRASVVFAIRRAQLQAEYWKQTFPEGSFLSIRYEELVSDPEPWIRRILAFCDLPWEEACLHASESKKKVRTPSLWQVKQPVYKTSIDRWRRYEPWLGEFAELAL
jgi:tetratricopeptide (TPR) repeat protein